MEVAPGNKPHYLEDRKFEKGERRPIVAEQKKCSKLTEMEIYVDLASAREMPRIGW